MVQPGSAATISACASARADAAPPAGRAGRRLGDHRDLADAARLVRGRDLDADVHGLPGALAQAADHGGKRRADAGTLHPDGQAGIRGAAWAVAGHRDPDDLKRPPGGPAEQFRWLNAADPHPLIVTCEAIDAGGRDP